MPVTDLTPTSATGATTKTTKPRKRGSTQPPTEQTIREQRDELFLRGSKFQPTHRHEIVGIDNVLGKIDDVIHWLRHSKVYKTHNSRLQPGVIFSGPPGTGKTTVSRYIATESNAQFINCREFAHKTTIPSTADIRDLFKRARAAYQANGIPVVLFWDEFETIAQERDDQQATTETRATVTEMTSQLDGVEGKNEGIVLIGCTNHSQNIDRALRRRGRMGLEIEFHAPDRVGKQKILSYYLRNRETFGEIDCETLSYFFHKRSTAADIEEAAEEAWRLAVRRTIDEDMMLQPYLTEKDLVNVFIEQLVGPPTTYNLPEAERLQVAVHETGHAIAALVFGVPLRLITVQPGKSSLGRVMYDDLQEYIASQHEYKAHMRVAMGSMAAEEAAGLEPMVGCTGDIQMVTRTAATLVDQMNSGDTIGVMNLAAMTEVRYGSYSPLIPGVSNELLAESDRNVRRLVDEAYLDAQYTLEMVGHDAIWHMARTVNESVTLTGKEFEALFLQTTGNEAPAYRASAHSRIER